MSKYYRIAASSTRPIDPSKNLSDASRKNYISWYSPESISVQACA